MTLSNHVRTLGRGPGRSRSLTFEEAADAMTHMLAEDAAPEAIGALLMLLRMKGETADEIAGFAAAAQSQMGAMPQADLDWPSYAAGRTRGAPWFLLSAKLVAQAGHKVLLHGWNGADPKVRNGLKSAGIETANCAEEAEELLNLNNIAYLPLEAVHPRLFNLLNLREVLGLRSCINTVCRMLNPTRAKASVQGVFHPSYRLLQADAALRLGWENLTVIKGGGGEFERNPSKDILAFGLRKKALWEGHTVPTIPDSRRLSDTDSQHLTDIWSCENPAAFETEIILGTAALALETLGHSDSTNTVRALWDEHLSRRAA